MCVYICKLRSFEECLMRAHHEGPHDVIFCMLFITCSAIDIFPSAFISQTTSLSVLPLLWHIKFLIPYSTAGNIVSLCFVVGRQESRYEWCVGMGSLHVIWSSVALWIQFGLSLDINFALFLSDLWAVFLVCLSCIMLTRHEHIFSFLFVHLIQQLYLL
jgi:hypothetical protein